MRRIASVLFLFATFASAEQKEAAVLEALLQEVRELRHVVERSAITVPRIQVAMQKWHMQQVRVDQLSFHLEQVKQAPVEDVRDLETQIYRELDPRVRRALEARVLAAKHRVAQEQQLAKQVQTEQRLLSEYQRDFRTLEAALEATGPKR